MGNIIDNAQHYAGGITKLRVFAAGGDALRFVFEDQGPGIGAEERATIFERFARGDAGHRAGASSGSGLGLSLVAEHVRLHQGQVFVEDNPRGGARFVVDLPLVTDAS
jgi:signal transduction histidine kinase